MQFKEMSTKRLSKKLINLIDTLNRTPILETLMSTVDLHKLFK